MALFFSARCGWMRRYAFILSCFCCVALADVGYAFAKVAQHVQEHLLMFEGFQEFTPLFRALNHEIDASTINGVKLSPTIHRDLYHPVHFGRAIPETQLKSLCATYARQAGISEQAAKKILMQARADYTTRCINLIMTKTGLPRRQAEALGGMLHCMHLLGDYEVVGNSIFKAIPMPEEIAKSAAYHLENLVKGGSDDVVKWANIQIRYLNEIPKRYKGDPHGLAIVLRRHFHKYEFGEMLNARWGKTLAKHGFHYDALVAKNAEKTAEKIYRTEGLMRKEKLLANPKKASEWGMQKKNYCWVSSRRDNEVMRLVQQGDVEIQPGTLQRMVSPKGEVVEVLTVPITKRLADGAIAGLKRGVSTGVLTFVFTQGTTQVMYQAGAITDDEFITETEKNCGASLVAGVAAGATEFVLVALGCHPSGWIILGVGITVDAIYGLAFDELQWVQSFSWENDWVFGYVPTEIQRRRTLFQPPEKAASFFVFPTRATIFDIDNNPHLRNRVTVLDYGASQEIQRRNTFFENDEVEERKTLLY